MADDNKKAELRNKLAAQYDDFLRRGIDAQKEHAKNLEDIKTLTEAQLRHQIKINTELLKFKRDSKELVGITKQIRDNEYELIDITAKLQRGIKGNREELQGIGGATADLVKDQLKLLAHLKNTEKITRQQYIDRGKELIALRRIAEAQEQIASRGDAFVNIYGQAMDEADKMASEIESTFS
jgi:hypothetical protein